MSSERAIPWPWERFDQPIASFAPPVTLACHTRVSPEPGL